MFLVGLDLNVVFSLVLWFIEVVHGKSVAITLVW